MKTPPAPRSTRPSTSKAGPTPFTPVIDAFAHDPAITHGKMFGSIALKVNGKVFAIHVKGTFVAKLPETRTSALVSSGRAEYFNPGHGRVMKEWIAMSGEAECWPGLAIEACQFVKGAQS